MRRDLYIVAVLLMGVTVAVCSSEAEARGLGGFHGGGGFGGRVAGLGGGGLGGAGLGGGLGGGELAGLRAGGLGGGDLGGLEARAAGLEGAGQLGGGLRSGQLASELAAGGGGANIASELRAAGLGGGAESALANRASAAGFSGLGPGGAPSRSQVANFLGLPSDNGLHNVSGETQSRLSQAYANARAAGGISGKNLSGETQSRASQIYDQLMAGDGSLKKNLSGETQSKASQLYDEIRAGDGPLKNYIPGETQSRASQIYDNIRAGDGPFKNFIPGETQKPLSRLYDAIRAGDHPFQHWSPWIIHNNAIVIRRSFNNYYIFTPGWYRRYPAAWYPAVWAYGNPWLFAPWPTLSVWMGCTSQPIYYNYGDNVVYQDNSIYVNGQDVGTADQYYQQAQSLAATGAGAESASNAQWMPLGVFAITETGQKSANLIVQLAVDKQGTMRGNMTDLKSDSNEVVHGAVDKQTQRAAWTAGDDTNTVYETGIYNLTKDETPVLVHYGDSKTEQLLLVRLDQKDSTGGEAQTQGALPLQ